MVYLSIFGASAESARAGVAISHRPTETFEPFLEHVFTGSVTVAAIAPVAPMAYGSWVLWEYKYIAEFFHSHLFYFCFY